MTVKIDHPYHDALTLQGFHFPCLLCEPERGGNVVPPREELRRVMHDQLAQLDRLLGMHPRPGEIVIRTRLAMLEETIGHMLSEIERWSALEKRIADLEGESDPTG